MNNYQTSTLLFELRMNYNYKLEDIAKLLGVSKVAVSKWENGADIAIEHLYNLAKIYNVSFSELVNGKLNHETDNDYWKRNYDLTRYEIPEYIDNANIEIVKNFFECCTRVKNRFFELLPLWAHDELSQNQIREFELIKEHFEFDREYYINIQYGPNIIVMNLEDDEKKFVRKIIENISNFNEKSFLWELNKLYAFTYDIKAEIICKSRNDKALEYMVKSFNQIEKDGMLYDNLHIQEERENECFDGFRNRNYKTTTIRKLTSNEIEKRPFLKVLLSAGANILYDQKYHEYWDEEIFEKVEGEKIEVIKNIYDKYQLLNDAYGMGNYVLNCWKQFSYNEYLEFIDYEEIDKLKDILYLKDSSPLQYYRNLAKRNNLNKGENK